jgi:hypothetical protein
MGRTVRAACRATQPVPAGHHAGVLHIAQCILMRFDKSSSGETFDVYVFLVSLRQ